MEQAVTADPDVAVTDGGNIMPGQAQARRRVIEDDEVVAEAMAFGERHGPAWPL
ncbi:hypothetical protein [Streptomyces sp. NPDC020607]|uniref:hypothetical protein n=1 Tax=Streptomyces sp. NPDC020607 TaxID=3365082 RepID=UPI0037AD2D97